MLEVRRYKTTKEQWDIIKLKFMAKSAYTRNALHQSFMEMQCSKGGDVRAFLTSLKTWCNELLVAGITVNNEDFERTVLDGILDALGTYASQLLTSMCLNGNTLAMKDIIHALSEEADRTRNRRAPKDQSQGQQGNRKGQPDEALAATNTSKGGNSRRHKGKCHHCGKEGHWVRECHTKKWEEAAEAAAAGTQSGQAIQTSTSTSTSKPENRPVGSANVAYTDNTDNEEFWAATAEVAHTHTDPAKPDPWTGGLNWDDDSYEVDIAPHVESPPLCHNALHAHAPSHTPASSGALDEEAEPLRIITPCRERTIERQNRMLLEQAQVLCYMFWAWLLMPLWGVAMQIAALFKTAFEELYWTPQVKGIVHHVRAGQLEGEEMRMSTVGSKLNAAPGTPLTSNALKLPAMPAKAALPAPKHAEEPDRPPAQVLRTAHVHKPLCIVHKSNSHPGRAADPGSHDPYLVPCPQCPGAFAEDPGDSGGVPTVKCSAPAPLEDLEDTEVVFAAEVADADTLDPRTFTETKCAPKWPPWEATTEKSVTCRACPVVQEPNHTGSVDYNNTHSMDPHSMDQTPASAAECLTMYDMPYRKAVDTLSWVALATPPDPALSLATAICFAVEPKPAHREPIKQTPHHPSVTHARTNSPPEGFANANGSTAEDWHAILQHASFIDSGTIPLPSRRHKAIPLPSTNKSKYVTATHSSNEAPWLRSLVSTFFDTPAAIAPICDCQYPLHTEHIDVQCHQPHQVVKQGSCLVYRPADNVMADAHTAPLSAKENHFAAPLGLRAK